MTLVLTVALVGLASVAVFADWKNALYAALLVGLLQDPLRKLTPDQPVYFNVLVAVIFGLACLSALASRVPLAPQRIAGWRRYLATPFLLFMLLIAIQAAHGYLQIGNPLVVGIGLLSYMTPLPAIMLAYQWALRNGPAAINRFLWTYVVLVGIALLTIYVQFSGVKWHILGEVGIGLRMYSGRFILEANSGIFRASEVAAWHAGTCVSVILMMLAAKRRSIFYLVIALAACGILIWMGILTGRRKSLAEVVLFFGCFLCMLLIFKRGAIKFALATAVAGVAVFIAAFATLHDDDPSPIPTTKEDAYVARSSTVFGDMADRFDMLGISPVFWAYEQTGVLGAGVGFGSQGGAQFGALVQGAAEGGLGKIMLELGLPGLLLAGWMSIAFMRHLWWTCRFITDAAPQLAYLTFGCIALLIANAATFAVATQVFADILVLLLLGIFLGFALAMPVLAEREASRAGLPRSIQPRRSLSLRPAVSVRRAAPQVTRGR